MQSRGCHLDGDAVRVWDFEELPRALGAPGPCYAEILGINAVGEKFRCGEHVGEKIVVGQGDVGYENLGRVGQ